MVLGRILKPSTKILYDPIIKNNKNGLRGDLSMWKKRLSLLLMVMVISMMAFATGCAEKEETAAPPPAQEQPAAEAPEVDEDAIVDEVVKNFLTNQEKTLMVKLDAVQGQMNNFQVIDIRAAEDFAKGHIEGAINMTIADIGNGLDTLPTEKPLLIVCYSGQNAAKTATAMKLSGVDAQSLIGGMGSWTKAELPVVQ